MAGWFKTKLSGFSYRYFLIAGISVLVFVLAIILFIYNLIATREELKTEVGKTAEYTANQLVNRVDERFNTFELYYISAMGEDEVTWLLNNEFDYSDYSRYKTVIDLLNTRKMFITYLDSFALMDYNSGWIISRKGLLKREELFNAEALDSLYRKGAEMGTTRFWNYTPEKENSNSTAIDKNYRRTVDVDGLCLVMRLPADSINTHSIAVIKLNMNTWKDWVSSGLSDYEKAVIIDNDGQVIWSTDEQFTSVAEALLKENPKTGTAIQVKEESVSPSMACVVSSDVLGWNYVVFESLETSHRFGRISAWVIMAVMILLVTVVFAMIAYVVYSPIRVLVKDISGNKEGGLKGNEFDYISNHLSALKDDKEVLQKMVNHQVTRIEEMMERRLINEGIKSEEEWNDYFENLGLPSYKCYSTMVLVLDLREELQSVINEDAICLEIIEKLPKEIRDILWMAPIYNSSAIFAAIGADDENELLEKTMKFFEGIKAFAIMTTGYSLLAGVSSTCHDHKHFRRAYRESVKALTKQGYEEENTDDSVSEENDCRFYVASKPSLNGAAYSNNFENDVRAAVKEVDRHKAYQTTDRFCEFLATVNSNDMSTLYVMRFVNSIILTGIEANLNPEEVFTEGVRQCYKDLMQEIEPRQIRKFIKKNFIDPIVDRLTEKMQKDSYTVMESIDKLLERTKGNLLLAECADELGVHQTYIWKILKMEKGKSFTEYAEKYKIEEAKKLLLQTNMSVQEIAAELDYANAQNFIRFFSKVTGVTPGKFRKLY